MPRFSWPANQREKGCSAMGGSGNWAEMPVAFSCTLRRSWLLVTRFATGAAKPEPSFPIVCGSPRIRSTRGMPSRCARAARSRAISRGKSSSSAAPSSAV